MWKVNMLPPVDGATLTANPRFDALYRDLCANKLNPDGSTVLEQKTLKEQRTQLTVRRLLIRLVYLSRRAAIAQAPLSILARYGADERW